jgi:hypothetical protein
MAASKPADGALSVAAQMALSAACGVAFGVAFDKSRVFQPDVIVGQARAARRLGGMTCTRTRRGAPRARRDASFALPHNNAHACFAA